MKEALDRKILFKNYTYRGIINTKEMFAPINLILKYKLWYQYKPKIYWTHQTFCKGAYKEYNNAYIVNKDNCVWKDLRLKSLV